MIWITIPTEHAENLAVLLFSHFAAHTVCSSSYLLTTPACQTCFAMWRWWVVSSWKPWKSLLLVWWCTAEKWCWKQTVCDQGAKASNSGPAPTYAKALFWHYDGFGSVWAQWAVQWPDKLSLVSYTGISATFLSFLRPKFLLWATSEVWAYKDFLSFHTRTLPLITKWLTRRVDALLVFYLLHMYVIYLTGHQNCSYTNTNFPADF